MTTRAQIEDFLAQKSVALIGLSRTEKDFSRVLMRELHRSGHRVFGVNPHGSSIEGERCFAHVGEIPDAVQAALLMVPDAALPQAIRECAASGITRLWVYGVGRPRKLDDETRAFCRERQLQVVNGFCPLMFLHGAAWPHHLHGWIVSRSRSFRTVPA